MSERPSTNSANADQAKYWNSGPGQKWIEFQDGIDTTFSPINRRLLEIAKPTTGERVLDIGCGTGAATMAFAGKVGPDGRVVGIDISRQLLDCAERRRTENGIGHIEYLLADAQTHPFGGESFDLLASRFGVMFFEDPVAAFGNLATALRPGGRLFFVSWSGIDGNPWFKVPKDAAVARLGEPAPTAPTAPGPLAFADIGYVLDILSRAGFPDCRGQAETVHLFNPAGVDEVGHLASNIGPAARIVKQYGGTPEDIREIGRVVTGNFRQYVVEGGVRIPAALNFFEAVKSET